MNQENGCLVKRNKGELLYHYAKKIIPGGVTLFSKRSELHLPDGWPAYFKKAKEINVWDLNGKKYLDMFCAVGTSILGYSNQNINKEIKNNIKNGNLTSLNCVEELKLAKKIISHHPWASMAKFTRGGGEANALAIRIARAYTENKNVAFCGYHGWHDWYLAANLNQGSLDNHLLKGLDTAGVPQNLKDTVHTFKYNDIDDFVSKVEKNSYGAVKMEVSRNHPPAKNFLETIRKITKTKNIVLIFDECTSGFRETYGGLHLKYSVFPDMAIFGKALGNGYAINAIIGTDSIMDSAQSTFISSTFWTERIGPTAALKTLEIMKQCRSWESISKNGRYIKKQWKKIFDEHKINYSILGLDALAAFSFESEINLILKTFITSEMYKKGFLASNSIYSSIAHDKKIIDLYMNILYETISKFKKFDPDDYNKINNGILCHSGFERLN